MTLLPSEDANSIDLDLCIAVPTDAHAWAFDTHDNSAQQSMHARGKVGMPLTHQADGACHWWRRPCAEHQQALNLADWNLSHWGSARLPLV